MAKKDELKVSVDESKISAQEYLVMKRTKSTHYAGKIVYATGAKKLLMTVKEWDEFYKKY